MMSLRMIRRIYGTTLLILIGVAGQLQGQASSKAANASGKSNLGKSSGEISQQAKSDKEKQQKIADLERKFTDLARDAKTELGDYVPCVFTKDQLLSLRLEVPTPRLTGAQAEKLKSNALNEAMSQERDGLFTPSSRATFIEAVSSAPLEGLTPSQALARIMRLLSDIVQANSIESQETMELRDAAKTSGDRLLDVLAEKVTKEAGIEASTANTNLLKSDIQKMMSPLYATAAPDLRLYLSSEALSKASQDTQTLQHLQGPKVTQAGKKALDDVSGQIKKAITSSKDTRAAEQAIVDTARKTIAGFERPNDIGCAMSILDWNETRYAFGSLLANEYIAVQVTVRNLNPSKEFLLHDVELAVDADPNGRYGRFFSGRDKIIVRALSNAQQNYSRRNFLVHTAEAVGTLVSAIIPAAGETFAAAAGVYNGGFLPGLRKTWADHNVDQMNLVSDIGFSSSMTYKTVVPKSGAVIFVTFVPSKQFEEGWWAQKCAQNTFIESRKARVNGSHQAGSQLGVDVDSALDYCRKHGAQPGSTSNGQNTSTSSTGTIPPKTDSTEAEPNGATNTNGDAVEEDVGSNGTYLKTERVKFSGWSGTSMALFRELAFVVVSGTHIEAENEGKPVFGQLQCAETETGDLDFLKAQGDSLSCTLTGEHLEKVATLRLRNAQAPLDSKTADGAVSVNGDSNSAKVLFKLDDLGALQAVAYNVYGVTKDGAESAANRLVHISLQPFLKGITPSEIKKTDTATKFSLSGYHLDKLSQIVFVDSATSKQLASIAATHDGDNKGVADLATWAAFGGEKWDPSGTKILIKLQTNNPSAGLLDTNQTLTVKGE